MAKGIIDICIKADMASGYLELSGEVNGISPEELTEVFSAVMGRALKNNGLGNDIELMEKLSKQFGYKLRRYSKWGSDDQ